MTLPRKPPFGVPEHEFSADRRVDVKVMKRPHSHSQIEVNFFQAGAASYLFNGREISVRQGDFVLFWAAVPHQVVRVEPTTRFSCVYIPMEALLLSGIDPNLKHALLAGSFIVIDSLPQFDAMLMEQIRADAAADSAEFRKLSYETLMLRLQRAGLTGWRDLTDRDLESTECSGSPHEKVVTMARFIADQKAQGITVDDIAATARLHPKYAMTLFRRSVGMTIVQYLNRVRIVASQQLLIETDAGIAAIAFEAGFGSVSQFHHVFREQTALTPRQFREKFRSMARYRRPSSGGGVPQLVKAGLPGLT